MFFSKDNAREIHSIDFWRFFAMFLVVAIHFPFPGFVGEVFITIGKTAVPFFIIVSGYFCFREDDKEFSKRLCKQILKLFVIMILSNVLYAVFDFLLTNHMAFSRFLKISFTKNKVKMFLIANQSPFADHLWFLGSMVYAMILVLLFTKLKVYKKLLYVSPIFLAVYITMSYVGINFIYCRNALFCTMPYFMFGCLMKKYDEKIQCLKTPFILISIFVCLFVSLMELLLWKSTEKVFIGSEFLTIFICLLLIKHKNIGKNTIFEHIGRRDTLIVYIIHIMFCMLIWNKWHGIPRNYYWFLPFAIYVASIICAEIILFIKNLPNLIKR